MTRTVTESELKDMVIDDYVNENYEKTYYITITKNKDFRIHNKEPKQEHYKLRILWGYWEDAWSEYCYNSIEEYDSEDEDNNLTEEQKENLVERMRSDKDQYRDYMSYKDHFDIDGIRMEISF